MKNQTVLQVGVLANDVGPEGQTLGPGTKARCDCALWQIRQWLRQTAEASIYPAVIIYLAAGSGGRWRGDMTFAATMEDYLRIRLGDMARSCEFVTNRDEVTVWSTLSEMRWVFHKVGEQQLSIFSRLRPYEAVRFVTNERHGKRVRFIKRFFYRNAVMGNVVCSQELPPPLWHETCAYLKLVMNYFGLGSVIEPLRRRFYNG